MRPAIQPGFTGSPLDRTDEERPSDGTITAWRMREDARVMLLDELDPVLDADGRLLWLPAAEMPADAPLIYLGLDRGAPRFAMAGQNARGRRETIHAAYPALLPGEGAIYACARSLVDWHRRHGFCASCGTATTIIRAGWARRCPSCNAEHFPRTDPVVIMLATHGGKALLGRQARFPPGRYSALAGYVEVGESIEEAVARELFEEAGVKVSNVRYLASQPWPFPSSLMIACFAEAQEDGLNLDTNELEDAFWATREEIAAALAGGGKFDAPPRHAIAWTLLKCWLDETD